MLEEEKKMKLWPFSKRNIERKIALTVPGPSPWYLRSPWASINTPRGTWQWAFYDSPTLAGMSRLLSPDGDTVLFLDFNCYFQSLTESRVLIWYEVGNPEKEQYENPHIVFTILTLPALTPIHDHEQAATELRKSKQQIRADGGNSTTFKFFTTVGEGKHPISPSTEFNTLPEQLVLADFGAENARSNHYDKMFRAVFAFNFQEKQVTVLPQIWFNQGSYDFGYQWITRVQREKETGQIVGEGIRLGNFRLDTTGMQVQEWLHKDAFYHPEQL